MNSFNNYLKPLSKHYLNIISFVTIIQGILFLTFLLLKKSNIFLNLIPFSIVITMYVTMKDYVDNERNKNFSLTLVKISSFFTVIGIVNNEILKSANKLAVLNPDIVDNSIILIFLVDTMITLIGLTVLMNENINEKINNFHSKSTKSILGIDNEEEEIKPGDAVIGYTLDTNKPVILPLKDRYLHMLIIGPTGSGKTSQSIIPMINRDMTNKDIGITVIEPKSDLAEKIFAMARYYEREVLYFNPILPDCPYFNPLFGAETDVIENMATTFKMLNPDSSQFFLDMNENTIRKALKILKRLYKDDATLLDLDTLLNNTGGKGKKIVSEFSKLPIENPSMARENADIAAWFLNDYYSGLSGERGATKTFEHCSGLRSQVAKLTSNVYLRKVLNPPKGQSQYGINFDDALARGTVLTITTAQGTLRDLGKYLGYFIILQLQASVFRRPGNEYTRKGNMLYIDEFQVYTNPGFADMLTQGRSYRVASHLATQARDQIAMGGGKDGKGFVTVVDANARNKIVYPGSFSDAEFYSRQFGEIIETEIKQTKAYDTFAGLKGVFSDKISESVASTRRARFTPEDIVFRPFGEITYCLIKNNSIQTPGVSKIQYIPRELNELLDSMVAKYNEEQIKKRDNANLYTQPETTSENNGAINTTSSSNNITNNGFIQVDSKENDNNGFIDINTNDNEHISRNIISNDSSDDVDILSMLDDADDDNCEDI